MKKTSYELEREIIEVLNKKRGKKVTLKDKESMFDVYYSDGITYECYLRKVWLSRDGMVQVNVEGVQGHGEWTAGFDTVSIYGREAIARQLGIKTKRKPTMQESYDIICAHYEHLQASIVEYVKAHADENGVLMLEDGDEASRPFVITTYERNNAPDLYTECRCVALRVIDDEVQFCAIPSFSFDADAQYKSSVLADDDNSDLWYTLDWDMANPFQHNIERIAYYLTVND